MITHSPIIFDDLRPAPSKTRARKADPQVSHDAAKRVELGKAEMQRNWIKASLEGQSMTVPEISEHLRLFASVSADPHEIGQRINEVEGIAPTGESRNGSRVWGVVQ